MYKYNLVYKCYFRVSHLIEAETLFTKLQCIHTANILCESKDAEENMRCLNISESICCVNLSPEELCSCLFIRLKPLLINFKQFFTMIYKTEHFSLPWAILTLDNSVIFCLYSLVEKCFPQFSSLCPTMKNVSVWKVVCFIHELNVQLHHLFSWSVLSSSPAAVLGGMKM